MLAVLKSVYIRDMVWKKKISVTHANSDGLSKYALLCRLARAYT